MLREDVRIVAKRAVTVTEDRILRHYADLVEDPELLAIDVRTELRDAEERVWGDTGMLTCWLDQDYTMEGNAQHVSAPTTIVFRREGGEWKLALFHSIPLPEKP